MVVTFKPFSTRRGQVETQALQYNYAAGPLLLPLGPGGDPTEVALSEMPARGRKFPARSQVQLLAALKDLLAPGGTGSAASSDGPAALDEWLLSCLKDKGAGKRSRYRAQLQERTRPFAYPHEVLDALPLAAVPAQP